MRWKTSEQPKDGDTRIVRRYAYTPTNLDDGYTVWLESYYAVEKWRVIHFYGQNHWKLIKTSSKHPDDPGTGTPICKG
jgi:hypothetical protein